MEFYYDEYIAPIINAVFQFPTGWNSTKNSEVNNGILRVSIPNGMEFYRTILWLRLGLARFNSQRDGILRNLRVLVRAVVVLFQFPTGWNSTQADELARL